ncbi:DUF202 domain-containing protein [Micromonospora sp. NPDC126480]|uniref:DUF202 domain-containing protein n=1 Tax=Micromonospora sp. NPDC126480 TaxID=3155312 RepID=UPI00331830B1
MTRRRPTHPRGVIDAGLQSERTYLAWQRTALAFAGVGALLSYAAVSHGRALAIPGGLGLLVGALLFSQAQRRYRLTVATARSERALDRRMVAGVAAAATLLAVASLGTLLATA